MFCRPPMFSGTAVAPKTAPHDARSRSRVLLGKSSRARRRIRFSCTARCSQATPSSLCAVLRFNAASARAFPASVFGPVDNPPWFGQRRLPGTGFRLHGCPARVLAPQRGVTWFAIATRTPCHARAHRFPATSSLWIDPPRYVGDGWSTCEESLNRLPQCGLGRRSRLQKFQAFQGAPLGRTHLYHD